MEVRLPQLQLWGRGEEGNAPHTLLRHLCRVAVITSCYIVNVFAGVPVIHVYFTYMYLHVLTCKYMYLYVTAEPICMFLEEWKRME